MYFPIQPVNPVFPSKSVCNLPEKLNPLSIINRDDSYFKRLWCFLTKRPEFQQTEDYITYLDYFGYYMWSPTNFVYDFASIPKFVPFINPAGVFAYPALPHDFIYRFGGLLLTKYVDEPFIFYPLDRKKADSMFFHTSEIVNGLHGLDHIATGVLRVAGFSSYKPRDIYKEDWTKPVRAS